MNISTSMTSFIPPCKLGEKIPEDAKGRLDLLEKKLERMRHSCEKLRIIAAIKHSEREEQASALA